MKVHDLPPTPLHLPLYKTRCEACSGYGLVNYLSFHRSRSSRHSVACVARECLACDGTGSITNQMKEKR